MKKVVNVHHCGCDLSLVEWGAREEWRTDQCGERVNEVNGTPQP